MKLLQSILTEAINNDAFRIPKSDYVVTVNLNEAENDVFIDRNGTVAAKGWVELVAYDINRPDAKVHNAVDYRITDIDLFENEIDNYDISVKLSREEKEWIQLNDDEDLTDAEHRALNQLLDRYQANIERYAENFLLRNQGFNEMVAEKAVKEQERLRNEY